MNTANTTTQVTDIQKPSALMSMMPFALIFVFMYFIVLRPQKKQEAARKEMRSKLKKGDAVVLRSGIICTFDKQISDEEAYVLISEGVRVKVLTQTIDSVLQKRAAVQSANKTQKKPEKSGKHEKHAKKHDRASERENQQEKEHDDEYVVEHDSEV